MYLFLDTETTGLSHHNDHIVQIAWILTDEAGNIKAEECHVIRPNGYSIPPAASRVHGITTAKACEIGQPLGSVLQRFTDAATRAAIVVAHNFHFDFGILQHDFKIAELPFPLHGKTQICTMRLSTAWCRLPKLNASTGFKYPRLDELYYRLFGEAFDGAHDALADTHACRRCYFELVRLGVITPPSISVHKKEHQEVAQEPASRTITPHPKSIQHQATDPKDAWEQNNLGNIYFKGEGVPRDYAKAMMWFRKAADSGLPSAQFNLGIMYANGRGVPEDKMEAMKWYRMAADQGHPSAQYNLGIMYHGGQAGLQQTLRFVLKNLGATQHDGNGLPRDYMKALMWFRKAADQGDSSAQFNLGVMYGNGDGMSQDKTLAMMWYLIAKASNHENADQNLQKFKSQSTSTQIAEAQRMAREWLATHPQKS